MAKTLLKGSVSASFVDAQERLQIINADNDLTDIGINRVLNASSKSLTDDRFIFTNLLLTNNLPTDKNVFTDEEIAPFLLGNITVRPITTKYYSKSITLVFERISSETPYRPDVFKGGEFDLFSLAYKLDDKWYIASRAKTRDSITGEYGKLTIPTVTILTVYYKLNINLLEESDTISFKGLDSLVNKNMMSIGETTFIQQHLSTDPNKGIYISRVPSEPNVLKWKIVNTMTYESNVSLYTRLFELRVAAPIGESEYEMQFMTASELDAITVAPTNLTSINFSNYDMDMVSIDVVGTPNSDIFIYFNDALYAYAKTDPSGRAVTSSRATVIDAFTNKPVNVLDGQEFTVKIRNIHGEHVQQIISNDIQSNEYITAYWESATRLVIAGKLGDVVEIYPDNQQVAISEEPMPTEENPLTITLDIPNTVYGTLGAIGYLDINLLETYNLAHGTKLYIRITDASGNVGFYEEERKTCYIGIENHFMVERDALNTNINVSREKIIFTAMVTKGSRL